MNTFNKILMVTKKVPKGKVTTYGAIANILGFSDARIIGFALHTNKDPNNVPCHRVINSKGKISKGYAFGGPDEQQKILETEGIKFDKKGKVDLNKFGFLSF